MNLSPLSWQSLSLSHTFQLTGEQVNFFDFQPKAQQALSLFKSQEMGSLLVVKSEVLPEFLDELCIQLSIENSQSVIVRTEFKASHLFGYTLFRKRESYQDHRRGNSASTKWHFSVAFKYTITRFKTVG